MTGISHKLDLSTDTFIIILIFSILGFKMGYSSISIKVANLKRRRFLQQKHKHAQVPAKMLQSETEKSRRKGSLKLGVEKKRKTTRAHAVWWCVDQQGGRSRVSVKTWRRI